MPDDQRKPESAIAAATTAPDRLLDAVARLAAPVCVGLDPVVERLPDAIRPVDGGSSSASAAIAEFCAEVVQAVAPYVPCVKFQSACFERFGHQGVAVLESSIAAAKDAGLEVLLDAKRGDIGISAEHYAGAVFGSDERDQQRPDWVTINSYLGEDGIRPFLAPGRGAFALVRTSNPGGDALQEQRLQDGGTIAEHVASMIARIGDSHLGGQGYSALGAVVGATKPEAARSLRRIMPRQIFLVPGLGAQGGGVEDVLPCFHEDGRGAIVAASRSIIYAFSPADPSWASMVGEAAATLAEQIGRAVGLRS